MTNPLSPTTILAQAKPQPARVYDIDSDRADVGFFAKRQIDNEVENCRQALLQTNTQHIVGVGAKMAYFVAEKFVNAGWKCEILVGLTWTEVTPKNYSTILSGHTNGATSIRFTHV